MNNPFKFMPVDLTDLIAISALSIGFILAINANMNELSMSLATGFFGYIGGYTSGSSKSAERKTTSAKLEEDISPQVIIKEEVTKK